MSSTLVRAILEQTLKNMDAVFDNQTAWENYAFSPVQNVPYQQVNLLLAQPDNPEQSANGFYREQGIFQITLNYPLQAGPADAQARAELLRSTFKRGTSFTSGAVTVTIDRTPEISPGRIDGDRWMVPVKIRFYSNVG